MLKITFELINSKSTSIRIPTNVKYRRVVGSAINPTNIINQKMCVPTVLLFV